MALKTLNPITKDTLPELFKTNSEPPKVSVDQFPEGDHSLLYGYTTERETFHVYIKDGLLHRHIFDGYGENIVTLDHISGKELPAVKLAPNKRIYSERTSLTLAKLLKEYGVELALLPINHTCGADEVPEPLA